MKRGYLGLSFFFLLGGVCLAGDADPLLLQSPTVSKTQIAFAYGGDIWIVDRSGGDARRLVTGTGLESGPLFSPDGTWWLTLATMTATKTFTWWRRRAVSHGG